MKNKYVLLFLRLAIAGLLLFSAVSKTLAPEITFAFIQQLPALREFGPIILSVTIYLEYLFGLMALLALYPKFVFTMISGMFTLFAAVILWALVLQLQAPCGCFGDLFRSDVGVLPLGRNIVLAIISVFIAHGKLHIFSLPAILKSTEL